MIETLVDLSGTDWGLFVQSMVGLHKGLYILLMIPWVVCFLFCFFKRGNGHFVLYQKYIEIFWFQEYFWYFNFSINFIKV